jgi:glycosyltransferase involved in cell wall biosynthesis
VISFIIPAYNEEQHLGATLTALYAAAREIAEPIEVIVVDDASTDRTPALAVEHGARVLSVRHRHIAATRNAGGREARGDIFFFIDADTLPNAAAIRAGLRALARGAVGGGCVFRFDCPLPLWGRILFPIAIAVCRQLKLIGGCFLFCRREAFYAAGGFSERYYAAEEWAFIRALKRQGRFVVPREMVVTSGRKIGLLTSWQMVWLLVRLGFRGPESFRKREALWYDQREAAPVARGDQPSCASERC